MDVNEQVSSAIREEAQLLLDSHLNNLSERLFEGGKRADQQITAWITFSSLTILLCFSAADAVSVGGLELKSTAAATVTYVLSCAFYYRVVLSTISLGIWREALRERRKLRFATLLQVAEQLQNEQQHSNVARDTIQDLNAFVPEYPGYLASSVLVKDEALKRNNRLGKYVSFVHKLVIGIFALSPYALAASLLYVSWFSWWYVGAVTLGVSVTLSANAILYVQQNSATSTQSGTPSEA
ncbi:hypothetical protein [Pseudomonas sp. R5(2019)]|uniref:hypothetical protein n=1 Tax=Pseudomonas sp. R5(2019) TaxID=2697566 RepID=UPI001413463E|nr:hypothetical protein [Pseudomonas sp. R5(2019)]NBA98419.1 hypothetical protein [Pseudomonas sp. R5(2019)]